MTMIDDSTIDDNLLDTAPYVIDVTADKIDKYGRIRKSFHFDVDIADDEQRFVRDILAWWKRGRCMAPNLRKAIALFYDLAQGRTDRLKLYFPNIVDTLTGQEVENRMGELVEQVETVSAQIDAVNTQIAAYAAQAKSQGYREDVLPPAPRLILPSRDDTPQVTISQAKKTTAAESGANFIKSGMALFFND